LECRLSRVGRGKTKKKQPKREVKKEKEEEKRRGPGEE
jgi:hypothetical protein